MAFGQDEADLFAQYQSDARANPRNSIAHFRIGEIYVQRHNYQSAANEFRLALSGDLQPQWIEDWSHVNLGKVFDLSSQRYRAVREYRLAQATNDNTRGALDEATMYLQLPYQGEN